ncbi:MAG: hypothetical protein IKB71_11875 [Lentisphaeria bacterium]|nr:hypothetical protein [Lentisphaeria bacterium]
MNLEDLVPPPELCKMIPAGEFEDSALLYCVRHGHNGKVFNDIICREDYDWSKTENYPAPTLQEILEDLHKHEEDVFLKWSEIAYNEWLINAYTTPVRDIQAHNKNIVTAAIKVWLELNKKGIENG